MCGEVVGGIALGLFFLITEYRVWILCFLAMTFPLGAYYASDVFQLDGGGLSPRSSESYLLNKKFSYPETDLSLLIYDKNYVLKPSDALLKNTTTK